MQSAGRGFFENSSGEWKETKFGAYANCVRGSSSNNVFVVGDFGQIAHFNGGTWYNYRKEIVSVGGPFGSVALKDNLVLAVGYTGYGEAIAAVGRR